jgi:hypothetical protein
MTPDSPPRTRYTENATEIVVELDAHYQWGVHPPQFFVIYYPDGRSFITPRDVIDRHFTIVSPQTVHLKSFGGDINRPNKKQRELDVELDAAVE